MRSHCAVYVDAGYLISSAATRATGTSLRSGVTVDYPQLITAMITHAEDASNLPLLRVNWYDSGARPGGVPDQVQENIGLLPRVKLRLGRLSNSGEQKGVDLRIGLDLVSHARNGAVDLIYLVSGDDDLTEAVEVAQGYGVQVIILALPNAEGRPHGVSQHLQRESDGLEILAIEVVDSAVKSRTAITTAATSSPYPKPFPPRRPTTTPEPPTRPTREDSTIVFSSTSGDRYATPPVLKKELAYIDEVCSGVFNSWLSNSAPEALAQLRKQAPYIPAEIDRALLQDLCDKLDLYDLEDNLRIELRRTFWVHVEEMPA